jgi:hypothetical protein
MRRESPGDTRSAREKPERARQREERLALIRRRIAELERLMAPYQRELAQLSRERARLQGGLASGRARQKPRRDQEIIELYRRESSRRGATQRVADEFGVGRRTVQRAIKAADDAKAVKAEQRAASRARARDSGSAAPGAAQTWLSRSERLVPETTVPADLFDTTGAPLSPSHKPSLPAVRRRPRTKPQVRSPDGRQARHSLAVRDAKLPPARATNRSSSNADMLSVERGRGKILSGDINNLRRSASLALSSCRQKMAPRPAS